VEKQQIWSTVESLLRDNQVEASSWLNLQFKEYYRFLGANVD
jgi:hypothetical protein